MLRAHRAALIEAQMAAPSWPAPALVFPSPVGTLLDASNVRRDLKRLCRKAQVPEVGPNGLRHSVASLLAHDGTSPARLTHLLGHTTAGTAQQYYIHNVRESADAAEAMGGMLGR